MQLFDLQYKIFIIWKMGLNSNTSELWICHLSVFFIRLEIFHAGTQF